ncbi:hypothetical protein JW698_00620 [Candidatus Wolfebacteria bacterium]|nr:hypothetical protein [Candidatus Wolfebacteria bacterium]
MKNFILGIIITLIVIALIYWSYPFIIGFWSSDKLLLPSELNSEAVDFGMLKVEVFGKGEPLSGVEVDLGKIGSTGPIGPMSALKTDKNGIVLFESVPIGIYDLFWNNYAFPKEYIQPSPMSIEISKDELTEERIELIPK